MPSVHLGSGNKDLLGLNEPTHERQQNCGLTENGRNFIGGFNKSHFNYTFIHPPVSLWPLVLAELRQRKMATNERWWQILNSGLECPSLATITLLNSALHGDQLH